MYRLISVVGVCLLMLACSVSILESQEAIGQTILDRVTHRYAKNGDVRIHYVSAGHGPFVVMLHGFPDYWYTWRDQMAALEGDFQVVAMDLRGYNKSDQPAGVDSYAMQHLMQDVIAVIKACGKEKAIVVGHDWGGAIAWQLAITHPDVVEKLIVCNMTHPTGMSRASIEALRANGNESYMDQFRKHTAETLPVSWLCGWVKDADAKKHYESAMGRSSVDGMINYYKANTRTREQRAAWLESPEEKVLPKVAAPVLAIFGARDAYVAKEGLNDTWEWLESDFTLVTIPTAGHFVQQDASELVSQSMKSWLLREKDKSDSAGPLNELSWLVGSWQRTGKRNKVVERWRRVSPNTLEGHGLSFAANGGEATVLEDLVITSMGTDVFYIPKVNENEFPVPFKLVEISDGIVVFENPTHDFPQRIEYTRRENGKMTATISDIKRQKVLSLDFERETGR